MELSREYIEFLRKLKKARDDEKKDGNAMGPGKTKPSTMPQVDDIDEDMMEEF